MKTRIRSVAARVYVRTFLLVGSLSTIALVLEAGRKWH